MGEVGAGWSSGGGSPAWRTQRRGRSGGRRLRSLRGEERPGGQRCGNRPGQCLCPEPPGRTARPGRPRERTPAPPGAVGTSCLVPAQRGLARGPHPWEGMPVRMVRAPAGQRSSCLREKRPGGGSAHKRTLQGLSGQRPVLGRSRTFTLLRAQLAHASPRNPVPRGWQCPCRDGTSLPALRCFPCC